MAEYNVMLHTTTDLRGLVNALGDLGYEITGIHRMDSGELVGRTSTPNTSAPVDLGEPDTDVSYGGTESEEPASAQEPVQDTVEPVQTERDSNGISWDARIHTANRTKNKDGSWRYRKGLSDAYKREIEAELKGEPKPEPANVGTPPGETLGGSGESVSGEPEGAGEDAGEDASDMPGFLQEGNAAPAQVTKDDLRDGFKRLNEAHGMQLCMDVLSRFGAKNLSSLEEARYADCKQAIEKAIQSGEA